MTLETVLHTQVTPIASVSCDPDPWPRAKGVVLRLLKLAWHLEGLLAHTLPSVCLSIFPFHPSLYSLHPTSPSAFPIPSHRLLPPDGALGSTLGKRPCQPHSCRPGAGKHVRLQKMQITCTSWDGWESLAAWAEKQWLISVVGCCRAPATHFPATGKSAASSSHRVCAKGISTVLARHNAHRLSHCSGIPVLPI